MRHLTPDLLFVYGSLRHGSEHPAARLLADGADLMGLASVQGILYRIDWYPGLIPTGDPGQLVHGDLYRMHAPDYLLPLLDEYEECATRFPQPHEYRREIAVVQCGGEKHDAWIYYYNRPAKGFPVLQTG